MILEPLFVAYIRIVIYFGHCHVTIPNKEIYSFVVHCHVTFPYMEHLSFLGNRLCNSKVCRFQIHFCHFLSQNSDGSHYATINPQLLRKNFRKKSLYSATTYEKDIVCKDYCIAHHNEKTCFLPACKYHIVLLGNVQELLKKLDSFCFTYQHVDCLYTLFKYRFSGKFIAKSGQVFDNVQRAVDFNHRNKGVDRMPSIAKKETLEEKVQGNICSAPFKRQKQRRPVVQCLQKELKKLKKLNLNSN